MKMMFTLWRGCCFSLLLFLGTFAANAQGDCGTVWYDTGGPTGPYAANENYTTTFCPDDDGDVVTVSFSFFNTEANWDRITVFDGPDTDSPQIATTNGAGSGPCGTTGGYWGTLTGNDLPSFTSTHESGCLTFVFCSDGSVQNPGWEATVSCGPPPNCESPILSYTQERDCDDFSFAVTATVDAPSVPATAPILVASASVDGVDLPGVGGTFNNVEGSSIEIGPLPLDQTVLISVSVFGFSCPTTQVVFENSFGCPNELVCGEALEASHCYTNNDPAQFLYVSPNEEPISFLFTSGQIQTFGDNITIYDGLDATGAVIFTGFNAGNLTGVNGIASSGALFIDVNSDGFGSCADGTFNTSTWNWTVACGAVDFEGCTDPEALNFITVATIDDGSCVYPAVNDEPCGALPLVCNGPSLTGDFSTASLTYNDACGGDGAGDLWFSFEANGTSTYLVSSTGTDAVVQLFRADGDAGCEFESLISVNACSDFPEFFSGQFEAGVYYFVVRQWSPFSTNAYNVSLICVDGAPDNDEVCGAIPLDCNGGAVNGSFLGATQTLNDACFNGSTTDLDIWYSFESDGEQVYVISEVNPSNSPFISLYTADECSGELTEINACQTFPQSFSSVYPAGTYYFRLRQNGTGQLTTVSLQCAFPPDNNDACGAFDVTANETCVNTLVSNLGASGSAVPNPNCAAYQGGDVWHVVNVDSPSALQINTSAAAGSPVTDTGLALYQGDCDGGLILLGCNDDFGGLFSQLTVSGVLPGEPLYIRTWEFGGDVFGTWNLCVTILPVDCEELGGNIGQPCNDGDPNTAFDVITADCECLGELPDPGVVCENAILVESLPYVTTDNTSNYADNYEPVNVPPATADAVFPPNNFFSQFYITGDDVVYSFTPESDMDIEVLLSDHGTWAGLYVFTGCPFNATVGYHLATDALGRAVTPLPVQAGVTYYVVISTNAAPQNIPYTLTIQEKIYDCQDLGVDIGTPCDDGDDTNFGDVYNEDCVCEGGPFDGCLTGFQFGIMNPECDGPETQVFGSFTNEFSLVNNIFNGADYTFTVSNPLFFITISNADGTEVLASGQGSLDWTADFNGQVRFYSHIDAICTTTSGNSHTRGVSYTCENQVFDCPDLGLNIGDLCDDGDPESLGDAIQEDCTCQGGPFEGCLTGFLWSAQPAVTCDGPASVVSSFTDYWTTLNVLNGAEYTFALDNAELFITISNSTGTEVLATGQGTLVWNATVNAEVRFYVHADVFCTQVFDFFHTRTVTVDCSSQVFDCPELEVNIGDPCDDGIPDNGIDQYNADCECVGLPFDGCLNGSQFGSATAICGTTQSIIGVWATEFSPISGLIDGGEYTFTTVGVDHYITIANNAGTEVLAAGQGTVVYISDAAQTVRFYSHVDGECSNTGGSVTSHTRTVVSVCPSVELPENDEACGAIDIECGGTITGTTVGATADDLPFCGTSNGTGGGLWYLYTPTSSGIATASLCGSGFDTKIRVFTGGCDVLDCVGGNDDSCGLQSELEFTYTSGEQYWILVHGFGAGQGDFTLNLTCVDGCPDGSNPGDACDDGDPTTGLDTVQEDCTCAGIPQQVNDDACGALTVECGDIVTGTTVGALPDDVPFCGTSNGTGGGLWYVFSPTTSGEAVASLCGSDFDTKIRIFSGACDDFVCVGGNDDNFAACGPGNNSHLEFSYDADVNYYILVHGFSSAEGEFNFELTCTDACPDGSIPGDACDDGDPETFGSTIDENCECTGGGPFDGCTTGGSFGTRTISCDAPLQTIGGSWANEYSTINGIETGVAYTFTLSNAAYFVTVTNSTGTEVLASGQGEVLWTSNIDGSVRFYSHVDGACSTTSGSATNHTRSVSANCDVVSIPECDNATFIAATPEFAGSQISVSIAGEEGSGFAQCVNADNPQVDKWFSFTSVTTNMYIRAWGLGDFNMAVEVYDACGGELLICQNDAPAGLREIVIVTGTTVGETYYFRTYHAGDAAPATQNYTVAVAHIPFTQLRAQDCGVYDYVPGDLIRSDWPVNQFLLANWEFEFTELEEPFNTYEIISQNGSNPNFNLAWFTQAELGRTYSVRTRARMYQGPNWGDYGAACEIGFAAVGATTQLIASQALGFYNMCDILEANNVTGATSYLWTFSNGFDGEEITHTTSNRFCQLQNVQGLSLGSPYAVTVQTTVLGVLSEPGLTRLIAMNNFVPTTGLDPLVNTCGSTYELFEVLSAIEICAAEFYTFQFTNISNPDQEPLFYTRDDGLRTIVLSWVTGLVPGDTYEVTVIGGSGGLVGTYGPACEITIAGGADDGDGFNGGVAQAQVSDDMPTIEIYPNPTSGDEVMLVLSNLVDDQQEIIIQVYDMYGKAVHEQNVGNNGSQMNTALRFQKALASGVYTVNIIVNENLIGAQKLVVQ